jgi:hypothetical protein
MNREEQVAKLIPAPCNSDCKFSDKFGRCTGNPLDEICEFQKDVASQISALYQVTPEQREKMAEIICKAHDISWNHSSPLTKNAYISDADQIISILQEPQEKEPCPECGGSGMNHHLCAGVFCKVCEGSGFKLTGKEV